MLPLWLFALSLPAETAADPLAWPASTRQCRPWAYNWWPGSAVDRTNLARELRRYREAGLGGIHVIPIYGAKGAEARYLEFLSPAWLEMLRFAVGEGEKLDLGVDLTTGTGWCFGGPNIPKELGGWRLQTRVLQVPAGGTLTNRFDPKAVQALVAVSADGQQLDLKPRLDERGLARWDTAGQAWKVFALIASPGGPAVKRAGPGGAGPMLNPFDPAAMRRYLERFTTAFDSAPGPWPRAMYHDSYEYNSSWTPGFLEAFARRRGYRLEERLPAFCGQPAASHEAARVRCDFRETVSDLMIEEVFPQWTQWCRARGFLTRNQAHGSPANLLDLYALADIPETEMFGRGQRDPLKSGFDERFGEGDRNPLVCKFASSAAHVTGRRLVAAETGTWMAEHFCETLEELKCLVDLLFCAGVNHVFYHGCCYSPDDAAWPGWLFYASTQMNPRNPIWRDAPALNAYIARCQAILQAGAPDNDVLLYWPIHELWHSASGLLVACTVHNTAWLEDQPVGATARTLWRRGYGFDFVSDRQLAAATADGGKTKTAGAEYRVVLVPPTRRMPVPTLRKLVELAEQGATVIFQDKLPDDVPGAADLERRRAELKRTLDRLALRPTQAGLREARLGRGRVLVGELEAALQAAGVRREALLDHAGALFIRRRHEAGRHYFIVNQSTNLLSGWVPLATSATSAVVLDPMTGEAGVVPVRRRADGQPRIFLHLEPGQSIILRTFEDREVSGPAWRWLVPGQPVRTMKGPWQVRFIAGGPTLPKDYRADRLDSWTRNGDPETERFAGTAVYSTSFDAPTGQGPWLLDLGRVCHSARVRLNGQDLGTVFMNPYRLVVDRLEPRGNRLEIEVTNLAANRIRDLDRRQVPWRIFQDINFVNIRYRPFDASDWPVFDSGLVGPVTLRVAQLLP